MSKIIKKGNDLIVKELNLTFAQGISLEDGEALECDISILDNRMITDKQRKFIFALCSDYEFYSGEDREMFRLLMQQFNANLREIEVESLSTCSMTYANGLIDTIITFMIDNQVPISKKHLDDNEYAFTEKQVYAMTIKRVCAVCGQRADIHHIDSVGMGNNRKKISHIGMKVIPLCRTHHVEAHSMGDDKFFNKYHLTPILVDEKLEYFIKKGKLKIYDKE